MEKNSIKDSEKYVEDVKEYQNSRINYLQRI
jgi:hypothetical protein